MRASTFFFLAIFAAMVWSGHVRCDVVRGMRRVCDSVPACCPDRPQHGRSRPATADPRVTAVEQEMRTIDQRGRDIEKSLQSIAQAERSLRDLARRHPDATVERELDAIQSGGRKLREQKSSIEARHVVLQARLELARAGLTDDLVDSVEPGRSSPVDALSTSVLPVGDF